MQNPTALEAVEAGAAARGSPAPRPGRRRTEAVVVAAAPGQPGLLARVVELERDPGQLAPRVDLGHADDEPVRRQPPRRPQRRLGHLEDIGEDRTPCPRPPSTGLIRIARISTSGAGTPHLVLAQLHAGRPYCRGITRRSHRVRQAPGRASRDCCVPCRVDRWTRAGGSRASGTSSRAPLPRLGRPGACRRARDVP